ncbi:putative ent-kaur-16-ene synthase, chloroplastic isoform X1 [Iris pallida]|uniref:Ent-kaur-16-ene synthase, chloroplastic isoform X1 n=1 Tax=Iris pallida TaxID=29817 RepID=A0AAX6FM05_IRIPA|nr:putative ent-kaur-16-ene synthase, chloroplastic isoform X1 [Iris pallida]
MQLFCVGGGVVRNPNVPSTNIEHMDHGLKIYRSVNIPAQCAIGAKERIREALHKVELSVSSYDTAWVAMVPSPRSLNYPCFPECVDWILDNQHPNGSWGLPRNHPFLLKDALSSTLACILALRRWNVGEEHIKKGLRYIGSNFSSTSDRKSRTPIGFDIIFPNMIVHAKEMGLDLPMHQTDMDTMCRIREMELRRGSGGHSEGAKAYHAYVAEGLSELHDWKDVMKFQKQNGSLFNSPSATAATLIHAQDEKSLNYLRSLVRKFGNAVPTIYPIDMYTHLCIIDNLERFGISGHFSSDIKCILDKIYSQHNRCWVENDEEIYSDIATCAMAFRILRMNGYDVSSDGLALFDEADHFNNSVQGYLRDMTSVVELYKASEIKILTNDQTLQKVNSWSSRNLKEELSSGVHPDVISQEVDFVLKYPFYANLERLEHKRNIEHYNVESFRLLKTSYINCITSNEDLVEVAVDDFNLCQSMYRKELEHIESWVKANKLDQLDFSRQKQAYCYFSAAATLFPPEMSDARICWAKNSVLTTVVDDFFDIGGTKEELVNFVTLVKKWDGNHEEEFCSERVRTVFSALYSTIHELGAKAWALQKRSITKHIIEIWLSLIESMMKEFDWQRNKLVPTLDEYTRNAYISFALGPIVLPSLYFVGPELSEDIIRNPEYHKLYYPMSTCGRLLNDIQGSERDVKEGKLTSLTLRTEHGYGSPSIDEAKREIDGLINYSRTELLKLVLQSEGSVVPRACKDLFWKMCRVLHVFYMRTDGFSSPKEMVAAVSAVIREPLNVDHLQLFENV